MHLGESHAGGKAISPLIAVLLSTHTYESSQNDLIILTQRDCYPTWCGRMEMELMWQSSEQRTEDITASSTFKIGRRQYLSK